MNVLKDISRIVRAFFRVLSRVIHRTLHRALVSMLVLTITVTFSWAKEAKASASPTSKPYELPWTYVVEMESAINKQTYELMIKFPTGYNTSPSDTKYPVVYILDGQYHFPLVSALYGNFNWDGTIDDAIIIGVTWGGEQPNFESLRQFDFTPSFDSSRQPSGNAANFLNVLKQEVIPFVETHYKAGDNRTLTGSSYGGLFALYALYNEPELFTNIVALSPSIWWDSRVINKSKATFLESGVKSATKLYMARGEYELMMQHDIDGLAREFIANPIDNLTFKHEVIKGAGHSGVNGEGFAHGIRFAFDKPKIQLTTEQLAQYQGKYVSNSTMLPEIDLALQGDTLYSIDPMGNALPLVAAASDHLYLIEFGAELFFKDIKDGKAGRVTLKLPRNQIEFTRK